MAETDQAATFLVFADDWGRHPSSCQHLVRHLLDRHSVHWVNTIGTRTPQLNLATLARGFEKMRQWARPVHNHSALPRNLQVWNPRMWPWFSSGMDRRLNRELLGRQIRPILERLATPAIALTTLPVVADFMNDLPVTRWVYYCVDDFGHWPGLDQVVLRSMEERLVEQSDVLIAASESLQERLSQQGRAAHLLTHGIDPEHWGSDGPLLPLSELEHLERPLVIFWGLIDRRMDVAFVRQLGTTLDCGTILLIGPESDPDPELYSLPHVLHLPAVSYEKLPQLAREAAVLIMPYADLPVTRAMQPLKLKEYLATGKPTVVRDLPAVREWADCLDLAETPESFAQTVRLRANEGLPERQRLARSRLVDESWAAKAQQLEQWALERTHAGVRCG